MSTTTYVQLLMKEGDTQAFKNKLFRLPKLILIKIYYYLINVGCSGLNGKQQL